MLITRKNLKLDISVKPSQCSVQVCYCIMLLYFHIFVPLLPPGWITKIFSS